MYTTNINIIASIPDFNLITDIITDYANGKDKGYVYNKIFTQNLFGIRTGKSRSRFLDGVSAVFLKFRSDEHKTLFYNLFRYTELSRIQKTAIYFQFAINDQLFYELTTGVFLKLYHAGRLVAAKSEFIAYLYNLREKNDEIQRWSNSTMETIASKYLTLLKKMNFLKGSFKKEFWDIAFDDLTIVFILYMLKTLEQNNSDILKNSYIPLF